VTEDDLRQAFERLYGPKVRCRIILWPKGRESEARRAWDEIRADAAAFDRLARTQAAPTLAAAGGGIPLIGRGDGTGTEALECAAFRLKPGEVSRPIALPDGQTAVLKCVELIPADDRKRFGEEKPRLYKEVLDRKVQREIPALFAELKAEAKPQMHLRK